ncbi:MAG: hypothetical protein RLZ73_1586, partial [Bacteroidota bacterium]
SILYSLSGTLMLVIYYNWISNEMVIKQQQDIALIIESLDTKEEFQKIIQDFNNGQIDFLVGTQLLSKGIDFDSVELICVPDADMSLNIPDFRSHERAFQQLYQLAGRAGRGDAAGKIIIQTHKKNHPVFQALNESNFDGFAAEELEARETFSYPPYGRLIETASTFGGFSLGTCSAIGCEGEKHVYSAIPTQTEFQITFPGENQVIFIIAKRLFDSERWHECNSGRIQR